MKNTDRSISIRNVDIDARIYQKSGEGYMEFSIAGKHVAFGTMDMQTLDKIETWITKLRQDYQQHLLLQSFKNHPHYNQIYWNH